MNIADRADLIHTDNAITVTVFGKASQQLRGDTEEKLFLSETLELPKSHIANLNQVHGTDTVRIHDLDLPLQDGPVARADGLFTETPSIALVVRTADCLPLFFYATSDTHSLAGVLHCGWRGLASGIIAEALDHVFHHIDRANKTGSLPLSELCIFPGPCIPPERYDVGKEVASRFAMAAWNASGQKAQLDLIANARFMVENHLRRNDLHWLDPFQLQSDSFNNDAFFSHRKGNKERNLNVILIKNYG